MMSEERIRKRNRGIEEEVGQQKVLKVKMEEFIFRKDGLVIFNVLVFSVYGIYDVEKLLILVFDFSYVWGIVLVFDWVDLFLFYV